MPSLVKAVADQALEVAGEPETFCQFHAVIGSFEVRSLWYLMEQLIERNLGQQGR